MDVLELLVSNAKNHVCIACCECMMLVGGVYCCCRSGGCDVVLVSELCGGVLAAAAIEHDNAVLLLFS